MKKNNYWRFILKNTLIKDIKPGEYFEINKEEPEILHQLQKVFRCRPEDTIYLINKEFNRTENTIFQFKIVEVLKNRLELVLQEIISVSPPFKERLTMAICLLNKPSKLEEILMRCTELGVSDFALIKSEFSNLNHKIRIERLEKIVEEAIEQSEQAVLPTINIFDNLESFLNQTQHQFFVAAERTTGAPSLTELIFRGDINLIIGPEGGFSEDELKLFNSNGAQNFSLGKTILRSETAAILTAGIASLKLQSKSIS